jgi:hypothetical protein
VTVNAFNTNETSYCTALIPIILSLSYFKSHYTPAAPDAQPILKFTNVAQVSKARTVAIIANTVPENDKNKWRPLRRGEIVSAKTAL